MSIQNIHWGEGVQGPCTLFPKFKNDDIISTNSSFYCFFIHTLLGEGGVYRKSRFCMLMKMMEKMYDPLEKLQIFSLIYRSHDPYTVLSTKGIKIEKNWYSGRYRYMY